MAYNFSYYVNGWLMIIEDEEHAYFLKTTAERNNKPFDKRARKTRGLDKVNCSESFACIVCFIVYCFRSLVELSRGLLIINL